MTLLNENTSNYTMNTILAETVFNEKTYKKNISKIYANISIGELKKILQPTISKLENLLENPIITPKQIIITKQLSIELGVILDYTRIGVNDLGEILKGNDLVTAFVLSNKIANFK